jgi:hypothetical protein
LVSLLEGKIIPILDFTELKRTKAIAIRLEKLCASASGKQTFRKI